MKGANGGAKGADTPPHDESLLSTHELKERGWTATLIRDFLGAHDATRPNLIRLGRRRRLPPVKLYERERVNEIESDEQFLVAQARAMDARERAERAALARRAALEERAEALISAWVPAIDPRPLRRGAHRKAFEAHAPQLRAALDLLEQSFPKVSRRDRADLERRVREKYESALRDAYPWYPPA